MPKNNNSSDIDSPKNKLDDLLEESKQQGDRLVEHGQNFTETGQFIVDLSSAMQAVMKAETTDIDIEPLIHDLQVSNNQLKLTLSTLDQIDISAVNSTAGTMSVSSGSVIHPDRFGLRSIVSKDLDTEGPLENLFNVINRYSNEEEVLDLLADLSFDQQIADRESPRDLFIIAHAAYKKPVSQDNPAVTSLIPIRESIRGVIDELLRRRPTQERTKNEKEKIMSIGRQLKRDSISIDLVESWSQQWVDLLNELSIAKEKELTRHEWLHQLRQSTIFMKNLLIGLDPSKFKSK